MQFIKDKKNIYESVYQKVILKIDFFRFYVKSFTVKENIVDVLISST